MVVQTPPNTHIKLADRVASIRPSATAALDAHAQQLIAEGRDIVNLTGGEPAFATVDAAARAGIAAIEEGFTKYTPAAGIPQLRAAVAARLNGQGASYRPENVVITSGAKQALYHVFTALLNPGDEVLIPAPYWVSYPYMASLVGARPVVLTPPAGAGLRITPAEVRQAITPRTRLLILNNPANPSGVVYSRAELAVLAEVALDHDVVLISDEICEHWVYGDAEFSPLSSLDGEIADRTVTVGGMSKTYAMTGWRIGWVAAPVPVSAAVTAIQSHTASAPSSISQRAALAALNADLDAELQSRRAELDARRHLILESLRQAVGIHVPDEPLGAFFVFADVSGTYGRGLAGRGIASAADFAELLLSQAQVAVIPGADFGAPDHVRLSYTVATAELARGLTRIADFTHSLEPVG